MAVVSAHHGKLLWGCRAAELLPELEQQKRGAATQKDARPPLARCLHADSLSHPILRRSARGLALRR